MYTTKHMHYTYVRTFFYNELLFVTVKFILGSRVLVVYLKVDQICAGI